MSLAMVATAAAGSLELAWDAWRRAVSSPAAGRASADAAAGWAALLAAVPPACAAPAWAPLELRWPAAPLLMREVNARLRCVFGALFGGGRDAAGPGAAVAEAAAEAAALARFFVAGAPVAGAADGPPLLLALLALAGPAGGPRCAANARGLAPLLLAAVERVAEVALACPRARDDGEPLPAALAAAVRAFRFANVDRAFRGMPGGPGIAAALLGAQEPRDAAAAADDVAAAAVSRVAVESRLAALAVLLLQVVRLLVEEDPVHALGLAPLCPALPRLFSRCALWGHSDAVFVVQRQVVRVIAALLAAACRSGVVLGVISSARLVSRWLAVLLAGARGGEVFSSARVLVECAEVLALALRCSCRSSALLESEFAASGVGYDFLLYALVRAGGGNCVIAAPAGLEGRSDGSAAGAASCNGCGGDGGVASDHAGGALRRSGSDADLVGSGGEAIQLDDRNNGDILEAGSAADIASMLALLVDMTFTPLHAHATAGTLLEIYNTRSFEVLLRAYSDADSPLLIQNILDVLVRLCNSADFVRGLPRLRELDPFGALFLQFDGLSLSERRTVLNMTRLVLQRGYAITAVEVGHLCSMLHGKRPSTVLLITQLLLALVREGRFDLDVLAPLLLPHLVQFTRPLLDFPGARLLLDGHELVASLDAVPSTQRARLQLPSAEDLGARGLPRSLSRLSLVADMSMSPLSPRGSRPIRSPEADAGSTATAATATPAATASPPPLSPGADWIHVEGLRAPILGVLRVGLRNVLKLMLRLVRGSPSRQLLFEREGGVDRLMQLLGDDDVRPFVLRILEHVIVGLPDRTQPYVSDLISMSLLLRPPWSADAPPMRASLQILDMLASVFGRGASAADLLRLHGFGLALESLSRLSRFLDDAAGLSEADSAACFNYMHGVLRMISGALKASLQNRSFFRDEMRSDALVAAFRGASRLLVSDRGFLITNAMIEMSIRGTLPLGCEGVSSQPDAAGAPLCCQRCYDHAEIVIPSMVSVLVQVLCSSVEQFGEDRVAAVLLRLVMICGIRDTNAHVLAQERMVSVLISQLAPLLLAPDAIDLHRVEALATARGSFIARPEWELSVPTAPSSSGPELGPSALEALLHLVVVLGLEHLSLGDAHALIAQLRYYSASTKRVVDALVALCSGSGAAFARPSSFLEMKAGSFFATPLIERAFPGSLGYSMLLWVRFVRFRTSCSPGGAGEPSLPPEPVVLLNVDLRTHALSLVYDQTRAMLAIALSGTAAAYFSEYRVPPRRWLHVAVVHQRIAGKAVLYVNGVAVSEAAVPCPVPSGSILSFEIGSDSQRGFSEKFNVGNVFLHDVPLMDEHVVAHCLQGADFFGDFSVESKLVSPVDSLALLEVSGFRRSLQRVLMNPHSARTAVLRGSVVAAVRMSARRWASSKQAAPGLPPSSAAGGLQLMSPNVQYQNVGVRSSVSLQAHVNALGGITNVLWWAYLLKGRYEGLQQPVLQLLRALQNWNVANTHEFRVAMGWELLALIISRHEWRLTPGFAVACFEAVGVVPELRPGGVQAAIQYDWAGTPIAEWPQLHVRGILRDLDALEHLVLNFAIWHRASESVRLFVLAGLVACLESSDFRRLNQRRMRDVALFTLVTRTFQKYDAYHLSRPVVEMFSRLLRVCFREAPRIEDLDRVMTFIAEMHDPPRQRAVTIGVLSPNVRSSFAQASQPSSSSTHLNRTGSTEDSLLEGGGSDLESTGLDVSGSDSVASVRSVDDDGPKAYVIAELLLLVRDALSHPALGVTATLRLVPLDLLLALVSDPSRVIRESMLVIFEHAVNIAAGAGVLSQAMGPAGGVSGSTAHGLPQSYSSSSSLSSSSAAALGTGTGQAAASIASGYFAIVNSLKPDPRDPNNPENKEKLTMVQLYGLLGEMLVQSPLSASMILSMFCMMLGRPIAAFFEAANAQAVSYSGGGGATAATALRGTELLHHYFRVFMQFSDAPVTRPWTVGTILRLLAHEELDYDVKHLSLKALHNVFILHEDAKPMLIDGGLLEGLCALLTYHVQQFSVRFARCSEAPDFDLALEFGYFEYIMDDVFALIRDVLIYSYRAQNARLFDDVVLSVQTLHLPAACSNFLLSALYLFILQFFSENRKVLTSTPSQFDTFEAICVKAAAALCWGVGALEQQLGQRVDEDWGLMALDLLVRWDRGGSELSPNPLGASSDTCEGRSAGAASSDMRSLGRLLELLLWASSESTRPEVEGALGRVAVALVSSGNPVYARMVCEALVKAPASLWTAARRDLASVLLDHTSPLLRSADVSLRCASGALWVLLLTCGEPSIRVLFVVENGYLKTIDRSTCDLLDNEPLVTGLSSEVRRFDERIALMRREWISQFSEAVRRRRQAMARNASTLRMHVQCVTLWMLSYQQSRIKGKFEQKRRKQQRRKELLQGFKRLVALVAHERGVFPFPGVLVRWQLDPTEGTHRVRIRLKPNWTLWVEAGAGGAPVFVPPPPLRDPNFRLEAAACSVHLVKAKTIFRDLFGHKHMQKHLFSLENNLRPGERIYEIHRVHYITPFTTREGELLIAGDRAYFFDEEAFSTLVTTKVPTAEEAAPSSDQLSGISASTVAAAAALSSSDNSFAYGDGSRGPKKGRWVGNKSITWQYPDVHGLYKRRYLLKDTALELFMTSGRTYLLAFASVKARDDAFARILKMDLPNRINYEVETGGALFRSSLMDRWTRGLVTNYEYLMHLNTLAGRSFNDLTQYPVFPFILRDYSSTTLDIDDPASFRDLPRPMGAQTEARLERFAEKYHSLVEMGETPYFYGSHYSNIGSVLYFMVRTEPFSRGFIEFQGGRFDLPDRSFQSLSTCWELSSARSSTDVKELIPEFYSLPELLVNSNRFNFGVCQDGHEVDNVHLPPWAQGSARRFVWAHRAALESRIVSESLHLWIDLIFGSKQQGDEAVRACNVFHPYTYENAVNVDLIDDPVIKLATIAQISSYGQTPRRLFSRPHPARVVRPPEPLVYVVPEKLLPYRLGTMLHPVAALDVVNDIPVPLRPKSALLAPDVQKTISWEGDDLCLHVCLQSDGSECSVIESQHLANVTCLDASRDGQYIVTGSASSLVRVWRRARASASVAGTAGAAGSGAGVLGAGAGVGGSVAGSGGGPALGGVGGSGAGAGAGVGGGLSSSKSILSSYDGSGVRASSGSVTGSSSYSASDAGRYSTGLSSSSGIVSGGGLSASHGGGGFGGGGGSAGGASVGSVAPAAATAVASTAAAQSESLFLLAVLNGHSDRVTVVVVSLEWKIFVTGSSDGTAIVWDLNRLRYVRTLVVPGGVVDWIAISPTTGEIVTADRPTGQRGDPACSRLVTWSINGDMIAECTAAARVSALAVTAGPDGACRNVVFAGLESGHVQVLDLRTLTELAVLRGHSAPVCGLGFLGDYSSVVSLDRSGLMLEWTARTRFSLLPRSALPGGGATQSAAGVAATQLYSMPPLASTSSSSSSLSTTMSSSSLTASAPMLG